MSDSFKSVARYIDRVTVKGSVRPIGLYTIDTDCDGLPPSKMHENLSNFEKVIIILF